MPADFPPSRRGGSLHCVSVLNSLPALETQVYDEIWAHLLGTATQLMPGCSLKPVETRAMQLLPSAICLAADRLPRYLLQTAPDISKGDHPRDVKRVRA